MPQPDLGNSYYGRISYSAMGVAGNVPNNGYLEVRLPIPSVLPTLPAGLLRGMILAQCRTISEAYPFLWITYTRFIDAQTVGVWWRTTTGAAQAIPAAEYELVLLL